MPPIARAITQRLVIVAGLGGVLVSMSEFWFYSVSEDVDTVLILLTYGLLGYLAWSVLHRFRVQGYAGFVVVAGLLGFLIEGVPVPVVYSDPPLSIVWTSLAWHGVFSIGLGWIAMRWLLAKGRAPAIAGFCAALGAFLGLWNAYMWNAEETVSGELMFTWQPITPFALQLALGYGLFLGGHLILDRLFPCTVTLTRAEHLTLWAIAAGISLLTAVASGLMALFPILPVLCTLCLLALWRGMPERDGPSFIDRIYATPAPLWRFALTALIPLTALPVYAAIVTAQWGFEANVLVIMTAGPFSVGVFLWGLYASFRGQNTAPQ